VEWAILKIQLSATGRNAQLATFFSYRSPVKEVLHIDRWLVLSQISITTKTRTVSTSGAPQRMGTMMDRVPDFSSVENLDNQISGILDTNSFVA
jgi:hypothetical protein